MNYDRKIPHVAAIHDLCGYGNCSLGIVKPVLSAGGVEVCSVPTAYLSAHTGFPNFTFVDTTDELPAFFQSWKNLQIPLVGAYTGFLGSARQIEMIISFLKDFPGMTVVVDPVMGDHGKIYKTYTAEMCDGMKNLAAYADVLTPNLTEACVLLDRPYQGQNYSEAEAEALCRDLLKLGAKNVVLKGIERGDGLVRNAVLGENQAYTEFENVMRPTSLHGTGDLFASLITAAVFADKGLLWGVKFAGEIVGEAIDLSYHQPGYRERGVSYEPLMAKIAVGLLGLD